VKGVAGAESSAGGPVPRDQIRAGNDDREKVVKQLNDAFSEGRLELSELEERVSAAYGAKTVGELRPLTADLPGNPGMTSTPQWAPPTWPPPAPPTHNRPATVQDLKQAALDLATSKINARLERDRLRHQRQAAKQSRHLERHQRRAVAHHISGWQSAAAWATVSAVCFTIWLIGALTGGDASPWFLWVAGPWGAILLVQYLTNRRAS
jgi:hypothetical protein